MAPADVETSPTGNRRALGLALASFTVCFYAWSLLGPLGPDLQKQLGLSDSELLLTVAVPVVLGSLMRVPLGMLTDRFGGRMVVTALMAFTPLPLIGLALFNDSWSAVLFFGFLLGFAGASFAVGIPFVNAWYVPARQGFALGIYGMGMGGTVIGAVTAPRIVEATSLDVPFWIAAGVVAIMAVIFWSAAEDAPGSVGRKPGSVLAPLGVFRGEGAARAWSLARVYLRGVGGLVAMFLFLPKLLTGVHDLSKPDAGYRAAGFAALAVIGRPAGGWLSDRIGASTVLKTAFTATVVLAIVLAATYTHMVPLTIACLTLAVFLGLGTGAVFKLVPQWFPDKVGAVTGVVGAAGGLGGFFPPIIMGIVKDRTGEYTLGFVFMAVVAAIALFVIVALSRSSTPAAAPPAERELVAS